MSKKKVPAKQRRAAVKLEGNHVSLEIAYKTIAADGSEYSDSATFSEVIGGCRNGLTFAQAADEVIRQAHAMCANLRAEGYDVGAFDAVENWY